MPSRVSQLAQQIVQDGRIDQTEAKALAQAVTANGIVSQDEKKVLRNLLSVHADKFEPGAKEPLTALLDGRPEPRDLPDPAVMDKHLGSVNWGKIGGGELYVDGVSYDDVLQGSIANCYLAGALSSLAHANPETISNAIKENPDGTFSVRFFERQGFGPMVPVEVLVDSDLPLAGGSPRYGKAREGKELWVGLVEKAYAQWKGGYEAIGNGGRAGEVMTALTGQQTRYLDLQSTSPERVFQSIGEAVAGRRPLAAGTHGKDSGVDYNGTGVYAWHVYSVLGASQEQGERFVELRNPWGHTEPGNDGKNDGIFKMKLDDFMRLYTGVYVG